MTAASRKTLVTLSLIVAATGAAVVAQKPPAKVAEGTRGGVVVQSAAKSLAGAPEPLGVVETVPDRGSQVIAVAALVVSTVQSQISALQTAAAILGALLGVAALVNLRVGFRFSSELDRIAKQTSKCDSDLKGVREQIGRDTSKLTGIEVGIHRIDEDVRRLIGSKSDLEKDFADLTLGVKRLMTEVAVLDKVILFRTGSAAARMSALRNLSQAVHPTGVYVMNEALATPANADALRREAAYGLGRFSEDLDLLPFWREIFECFVSVLREDSTPPEVALATIDGAMKFEPLREKMPGDLREAFDKVSALFLKWDRQIEPDAS